MSYAVVFCLFLFFFTSFGPSIQSDCCSFKSIDPSACHASAHPIPHGDTVAFSVHDDAGKEEPNVVTVSEAMTRSLCRLKRSASDFFGKDVNAAVVTVPTDFTDAQRNALAAAAKAAGLDVLQFIAEPLSALLAYDGRPDVAPTVAAADRIVVIADLGGTRSDVTVVAARGGMYTILATVHDYTLGGVQLDQVLIEHFAKEFIKKHKTDPRNDVRGLAKLKMEAEATKKALSIGANASFSVESLVDGIDYRATINRTRYELLAGRVFGRFTSLITDAVHKAALDTLDVNQVILAGGTSHTPKIARLVQAVFPPSPTSSTAVLAPATNPTAINPSELSARGAAIQASLIEQYEHDDIDQSAHPMVTVTPHLARAVGIEILTSSPGGDAQPALSFKPVLAADTALPARRLAHFNVPASGGNVLVRVAEGEREIKVTKPEPKPNSEKKEKADGEDEDEDESDLDEEEEEEEIREVVWKTTKPLAELAVRDVKAGGKVEAMVHVDDNLGVQLTAREVGSKGGVRGAVSAPTA